MITIIARDNQVHVNTQANIFTRIVKSLYRLLAKPFKAIASAFSGKEVPSLTDRVNAESYIERKQAKGKEPAQEVFFPFGTKGFRSFSQEESTGIFPEHSEKKTERSSRSQTMATAFETRRLERYEDLTERTIKRFSDLKSISETDRKRYNGMLTRYSERISQMESTSTEALKARIKQGLSLLQAIHSEGSSSAQ